MNISIEQRKELENIANRTSITVLGLLRLELASDPYWPQIENSLTDSFKRVAVDERPHERMKTCREFTFHAVAHRLEGKPCWNSLKSRLLAAYSDQRGALHEIAQLLGGQS